MAEMPATDEQIAEFQDSGDDKALTHEMLIARIEAEAARADDMRLQRDEEYESASTHAQNALRLEKERDDASAQADLWASALKVQKARADGLSESLTKERAYWDEKLQAEKARADEAAKTHKDYVREAVIKHAEDEERIAELERENNELRHWIGSRQSEATDD